MLITISLFYRNSNKGRITSVLISIVTAPVAFRNRQRIRTSMSPIIFDSVFVYSHRYHFIHVTSSNSCPIFDRMIALDGASIHKTRT